MARYRMIGDRDPDAEIAVLRAEVAALREQLDASRGDSARARVATMVTTIRSIFSRTVASGGTIEGIVAHFGARLDVLARHHQNQTGLHDLEMLIRDELREFQFGEDPRITIGGRITCVQASQAQVLGLALHELVTNALKFGALSRDDGRLEIAWSVVEGELRIDWTESGVPVAQTAAAHHGVGRVLIEQDLPDQLDARTRFLLRADGLHCQIAFALDRRITTAHPYAASFAADTTLLQ